MRTAQARTLPPPFCQQYFVHLKHSIKQGFKPLTEQQFRNQVEFCLRNPVN